MPQCKLESKQKRESVIASSNWQGSRLFLPLSRVSSGSLSAPHGLSVQRNSLHLFQLTELWVHTPDGNNNNSVQFLSYLRAESKIKEPIIQFSS